MTLSVCQIIQCQIVVSLISDELENQIPNTESAEEKWAALLLYHLLGPYVLEITITLWSVIECLGTYSTLVKSNNKLLG
jgi:hypothetical protein